MSEDMIFFRLMFLLIPGFLGIVFFTIGFFIKRSENKKKYMCDASAAATVVEIVERRDHDSGGHTYLGYSPKIEYNANGRDHQNVLPIIQSTSKYYVGQQLTVFYNRDNPAQFYVEGDKMLDLVGIIFIIVGIVVAVFGVAIFFISSQFINSISNL